MKHLGEGRLKDAGAIQTDLQLHNVNIVSYYIDKYALWLDFRTIDDNSLLVHILFDTLRVYSL